MILNIEYGAMVMMHIYNRIFESFCRVLFVSTGTWHWLFNHQFYGEQSLWCQNSSECRPVNKTKLKTWTDDVVRQPCIKYTNKPQISFIIYSWISSCQTLFIRNFVEIKICLKSRFKLGVFQYNLLLLSQISMCQNLGFLKVAFQSHIYISIQIMFVYVEIIY